MSDSVQPHRRQPTRLPRPWDSPGKNTGVGCPFLLQCMTVKSESEVAQSCLTLGDPMDCSLPGSSVHGIFPGKSTGVGCHCFLHQTHGIRSKFRAVALTMVACSHVQVLQSCATLRELVRSILWGEAPRPSLSAITLQSSSFSSSNASSLHLLAYLPLITLIVLIMWLTI